MIAPRSLRFDTEQQVIDEIARLRGGHRQAGNWTLAQICWHVSLPIEKHLNPPVPMDLVATPEQAAIKAGFVDYIIANRQSPPHARNAPPQFVPPATAGEADIERYVQQLHRLSDYPHPKVMMGPVGPVTVEEFRACNVFHAAHHMAFLVPTVARRTLKFADFNAVRADVKMLRTTPHVRAGNWSLMQACWHLRAAFDYQLNAPQAPATDEQVAARPLLENALATGVLPSGLKAPDAVVPPESADESDIDGLLVMLDRVARHPGPTVMHRRFGPLPVDQYRRLSLMHCAHHLSHLVPA